MSCQFPGCSKPVYPGGLYCSRSHRDNATGGGNSQGGSGQGGNSQGGSGQANCQAPGCSKAVFPGSLYCSKTHRDNATGGGNSQGGNSQAGSGQGGSGQANCQAPGCSKAVFPGSLYCSKTHRDNATGGGNSQGGSGQGGNSQGGSGQGGSGQGICQAPGCSKPVFPGGLYCSKTHRNNVTGGGNSQGGSGQGGSGQGICQAPGCSKPVFPGSLYCSRSHRNNATGGGNSQGGSGQGICQAPGCSKPAFPGGLYCSKIHRDNARGQGGGGQGVGPQVQGGGQVTMLRQLAQTDSKYHDVQHQFDAKWLHSTRHPTVVAIYQILVPDRIFNAYKSYRASVEARGGFKSAGKTQGEGNECRRFHGTNRACSVGNNGSTAICSSAQCALCGIMTNSFKLTVAGSNKPWQGVAVGRLGRGIYTSSTSSKSDDYSKNVGNVTSRTKAMLLSKVVVGRTTKLHHDDPSITQPPAGFDSVVGEPVHALSGFNYDELVVYREDAVIPAYLIIYN